MKFTQLLSLLVKGKKPRHSWTVRLLHWLYVPAVLACIFSGSYINGIAGFRGFNNIDAARKTHFIAQFTLLFSFLARVCYGFKDKNYKEIIPDQKTIAAMPKFLKHEFFLTKKKPQFPKYNPGQKFLFIGLVIFISIQIITGLALYSTNSWQRMVKLTGGLNPLRKIHFLSALATSSLASGHLYFVFTEGPKKLKSIFTGYE